VTWIESSAEGKSLAATVALWTAIVDDDLPRQRPVHRSIFSFLGHALAHLGRLDEAEFRLRQGIALMPEDALLSQQLALLMASRQVNQETHAASVRGAT
jgi:hypothetical protein